jgi:hypothetical protein
MTNESSTQYVVDAGIARTLATAYLNALQLATDKELAARAETLAKFVANKEEYIRAIAPGSHYLPLYVSAKHAQRRERAEVDYERERNRLEYAARNITYCRRHEPVIRLPVPVTDFNVTPFLKRTAENLVYASRVTTQFFIGVNSEENAVLSRAAGIVKAEQDKLAKAEVMKLAALEEALDAKGYKYDVISNSYIRKEELARRRAEGKYTPSADSETMEVYKTHD